MKYRCPPALTFSPDPAEPLVAKPCLRSHGRVNMLSLRATPTETPAKTVADTREIRFSSPLSTIREIGRIVDDSSRIANSETVVDASPSHLASATAVADLTRDEIGIGNTSVRFTANPPLAAANVATIQFSTAPR